MSDRHRYAVVRAPSGAYVTMLDSAVMKSDDVVEWFADSGYAAERAEQLNEERKRNAKSEPKQGGLFE